MVIYNHGTDCSLHAMAAVVGVCTDTYVIYQSVLEKKP